MVSISSCTPIVRVTDFQAGRSWKFRRTSEGVSDQYIQESTLNICDSQLVPGEGYMVK